MELERINLIAGSSGIGKSSSVMEITSQFYQEDVIFVDWECWGRYCRKLLSTHSKFELLIFDNIYKLDELDNLINFIANSIIHEDNEHPKSVIIIYDGEYNPEMSELLEKTSVPFTIINHQSHSKTPFSITNCNNIQ